MSAAQQPTDKPRKYQSQTAVSTTSLTIANRTGHRRILHDLFVKDGASGYTQIQVGNLIMARIYDNLAQAIFMQGPLKKNGNVGFLGTLEKMIPKFPTFNASQDESLVFTRDSTFDLMLANYEDVDSGDVTSRTGPGGSQSKIAPFFLNMSNAAAISASANGIAIAQQDMPTGLSIFSDNNRIASGQRFTMYGIAANVPKATSSKTTRIHVFDENTELFTSETNQGLLCDPDLEGELQFTISPLVCKWLDDPYVWNANTRMTITADATYDGTHPLTLGSQQVFMIGVREYL